MLAKMVRRTSIKRATEQQKHEKISKSKTTTDDASASSFNQDDEPIPDNDVLMRELEQLKEEKETQEQLVTYFMNELKQTRERQKELQERDNKVAAFLRKLLSDPHEARPNKEEIEDLLHNFEINPTQTQPQLSGDDLVNALLGVKLASDEDGRVPHPQVNEKETGNYDHNEGGSESFNLAQASQPVSELPSSPLWNVLAAEFLGNLDDTEPLMPPLSNDVGVMLDFILFFYLFIFIVLILNILDRSSFSKMILHRWWMTFLL